MRKRQEAFSRHDQAAVKRLWATHSLRSIGEHLGRSPEGIRGLAARMGLPAKGEPRGALWTADDDAIIRAQYADTPTADLAALLGRSVPSVQSRAKLLGIGKSAEFLTEQAKQRGAQSIAVRGCGWGASGAGSTLVGGGVVSDATLAADFLRKFCPVTRCDAAGRFAHHGPHWRIGQLVLTESEIIARAARKGWGRV
jgi:hypothetical protein